MQEDHKMPKICCKHFPLPILHNYIEVGSMPPQSAYLNLMWKVSNLCPPEAAFPPTPVAVWLDHPDTLLQVLEYLPAWMCVTA